MQMAAHIRIVLIETSHPGNIGAAARAMKVMGLSRLYLVRPHHFPNAEASSRASGADDLLANAVVCDDLESALVGCQRVYGASARSRTIPWPEFEPRHCAEQVVAEGLEVALVFGRENSGLTNEELDRCNYLLHIPTNPDYSSLNLAAAVQVVSYELRLAMLAAEEAPSREVKAEPLATSEEIERFHDHLQETLVELEFLDPENPRQLMRRLHRLFNRAALEVTEVNILRGILTAAQKKARGIFYGRS